MDLPLRLPWLMLKEQPNMRLNKKKEGIKKMAKVKIGKEEYTIPRLNNKDIKKMERYRTEKKLDVLDFDTYIIIYTIQKADPTFKMYIDEFDEFVDAADINEIRKTINDNSGLTKYIEKTKSKNLTPGIGKA